MTSTTNLFHRGHYNILAKQIRTECGKYLDISETYGGQVRRQNNMAARAALLDLAVSLAKRLKEDNEAFDPIQFLGACSPDSDLYPFSEFWEG